MSIPRKHFTDGYVVAEIEKQWKLEHPVFGNTIVNIEEAIAALMEETPKDWDFMDLSAKIYSAREILLSAKMAPGVSIDDYQEALKLLTLLISFTDELFTLEKEVRHGR